MPIEKYINHSRWIISALKEHNKIIKQEMNNKLCNRQFEYNGYYKKFCSLFFTYCKLLGSVDKEYQILLNSNNINKHSLTRLYNTYQLRAASVFKESGYYIKVARQEMMYQKNNFILLFQEMKMVADLLMIIQHDFVLLVKNLH